MSKFNVKSITVDVLIVGGGTAGCYAAAKLPASLTVLIAEKANIKRSGCLAAGVNALNAYITPGHTPADYVEYMRKDAEGIIRDDLALTLSERLNEVTHDLERRGLVILKDENGEYVSRGWRNIKINGENIKPILAAAASERENVTVLNRVNITDLKLTANGRRAIGAYGFGLDDGTAYDITARAVLIATGGAAGIYRPNNPGFSRHKMWYSPFNVGSGYAMGIRAGAELTTLEQRFVALRCKDTIAPTGTIAQGVGAKQVNSRGEVYETKYGLTTPERIYGTVEENRAGRGPCYLDTTKIDAAAEDSLYRAYLNMAPAQTLKWLESGRGPRTEGVEIEGTEPYIVGGHTGSGYWVDTRRETTIAGLYAAGDVAGGAPQKYVTGALAEAAIAADSIAAALTDASVADKTNATKATETSTTSSAIGATDSAATDANAIFAAYEHYFANADNAPALTYEELTDAMQKVMDEYAGGISAGYRYNAARLKLADTRIVELERLVATLAARDAYELMHIYELRDRLTVARALIAHLGARHETRWHIFGENSDYPERSTDGECYVNSRLVDGELKIIYRPLVKEARYEHQN